MLQNGHSHKASHAGWYTMRGAVTATVAHNLQPQGWAAPLVRCIAATRDTTKREKKKGGERGETAKCRSYQAINVTKLE